MKLFRCVPALALLLGLSAPLEADEGDAGSGADELNSVVISAESLNAADGTDAGEGTGVVRVIEREQFGNRIGSLAETLGHETGVQIRRTGGTGSPSSVSIRGSSSRQVQVYLDGLLLNDPVYGGADLSLYSLHDIARIKVFPGSPPARFAEAGVGGAVSMTSLDPKEGGQSRISLGSGSHNTRKAGIFHSGGNEDWDYWLSLNRQSADNDFTYENRLEWFNPNDGKETTRRNADFAQNDASAKLEYRFGRDRRINALFQWSDRDRGVPTIQNWRDNEARLETENRRAQFHYEDLTAFDGRLHQSHRLVAARTDEHYRDRRGRVGSGRRDLSTEAGRLGINSSVSWIQGLHLLSGTVKLSRHEQEENDRLRPARPDLDRNRVRLTSVLSHEWQSDQGRLKTQLVGRRYTILDESEQVQPDNSTVSTEDRSRYNGWHVGGRYGLTSSLAVYANLARQVRVPTLVERFGQQGLFVGNGDLRAEEALNAEEGVRWEGARSTLEVTGFQRDLDPAIVAVYDARGVGRYINVAAEFRGIEMDAEYDVLDAWTLGLSGTSQDSRNLSNTISGRDDKRLPGVYHQSAELTSTVSWSPFSLELSGRYDDELFYDTANRLRADPRSIVNASVSWAHEWARGGSTRVNLEVRNVTDELYQDFNRFPGPGRSFFANLEHSF